MKTITSASFKKIFEIEGLKRKAIVKENPLFDGYFVSFYYDGYPYYEWKRGASGIAGDVCDTLKQAKEKAKRYIEKDYK